MHDRRLGFLMMVMIAVLGLAALAGCGRRTLRFDLVPVEEKLEPVTVTEGDAGVFTFDKVAVINVSGLISNMRSNAILSGGTNKVSDFRETLDAIAKDPSVKAVVLRINSPGGTVTASDVMYKDLLAFREKTKKPVVVMMLDLCASGGYYLSCAADYRIAYPTTITGSIGVIIQTLNFSGTLDKIGVSAKAITSRENKDVGNPFRPRNANDEKMLQGLVNEFFDGFKSVVKSSRHHIDDANWDMVTDGRVFTGRDAVKYGLIDELGTMDSAIAKAKLMAGIRDAKIIMYTRRDDVKGSAYATAEPGNAGTQVNMINVNIPEDVFVPTMHPQFLYLWTGN